MYNRKDRDVHERKEDGQSEFEALNGTNAIMSDNSKAYSIKFLTFNTWGLKYVSKHRKERLRAIADKLAGHSTLTPISDELSFFYNPTFDNALKIMDALSVNKGNDCSKLGVAVCDTFKIF